MSIIIDNIELDKGNIEFNRAAEFVTRTNNLVYLTGKAGTGKTTFLKYIKEITNKNTIILAPTGVAAINAGGVTINSFFQVPFGPFIPNDPRFSTNSLGNGNNENIFTTFNYSREKLEIIRNLELLIIDEISMVRADMLDVIDNILKVYRKKPFLPFGGVQVLLIGDTFQLPPIANNEVWGILKRFYKTPFFFSSKVIENNKPTYIELKKIYRQKEQDFIDLLNRVRINQVNQKDFQELNLKCNPSFSGNGSDYIILATHNRIVNETNQTKLDLLRTELYTFEATVEGLFPEKHKPTDHFLDLKVDAQIMFVRNDSSNLKKFFNGKIGRIKELGKDSITVVFDNKSEVEVTKEIWENIRYSYNKEKKQIEKEIIGTFKQYPIRLAWAITVHKSQGLTFEKVIADLNQAFAPGQVYVALSRCTSSNGLVLKTPITPFAIKTDKRVLEFAENETPDTLIIEQLNTGKANFYYNNSRLEFKKGNFKNSLDNLLNAIKFRNDIETKDFERFIVIEGKRIFNYKFKTKKLQEKLENADILTDELLDINEALNNELSKKDDNISQLKNRIKELENNVFNEIENNQINMQEIKRLKNLKWYKKLFGDK